jgi:hypothetical protein
MAEPQAVNPQPLDELMLAMDVVDTLRHNQRLVDREIHDEGREQALMQRLREIYTSQGIAVPDHILVEGVAALREQRFVYQPPAPSLAVRLAHLYVNRGRWGKPVLLGIGLLAAALVVYQLSAKGLQQHRLAQQQTADTEAIASWDAFLRSAPDPPTRAAGEVIHTRVQASLQRGDVHEARTYVAQLETLQQLQAALQEVKAEAKVAEVVARAQQSYADGLAALRHNDGQKTQVALNALQTLRMQLVQEYTLRMVSRPGEASGVWRVPAHNPRARNYYVIVEAVAPDGNVLTLPIRNEEDGQTYSVSKWGLRIPEQVFARIRADKEDDGIIQNWRAGVKHRGAMEPEYVIPTRGEAITRW